MFSAYCQVQVNVKAAHIKKHDFPEDGQELRPKQVAAIINKQTHCSASWC
jgi:hypothetical protein